jgi:hypothetical protein
MLVTVTLLLLLGKRAARPMWHAPPALKLVLPSGGLVMDPTGW